MGLVIKKIVDLSNLGDSYKGVEITFRSIPAKDIGEIDQKQKEFITKDDEGNDKVDVTNLMPYMISLLKKYFVSGKQDESAVEANDLDELDAEALTYCFQILSGQEIDPKVKG